MTVGVPVELEATTSLAGTATVIDRHRGYAAAVRSPRGIVGLCLVGVLVVVGIAGPLLIPYRPDSQARDALVGPSGAHWLGTDEVGRDLLTRIIYGLRTDLLITLVAVPIAAAAGTLAGLLAVVSKPLGNLLQRGFDVLLGVPAVILGVGLALALGPGTTAIIVTVALATSPIFGRQARAALDSQLSRDFVTAALVVGTTRTKLLTRHILPNVADSIVALIAVAMASAVTIEGALSVMGIGVVPPAPSLGTMIKDGAPYLFYQPQYALAPVILVVLLVFGYTLIGDALNASVLRK
jgi:peptide/nickel transport system permease protein